MILSIKNKNALPGQAGHWDLHQPERVSYLPQAVGQSFLSYCRPNGDNMDSVPQHTHQYQHTHIHQNEACKHMHTYMLGSHQKDNLRYKIMPKIIVLLKRLPPPLCLCLSVCLSLGWAQIHRGPTHTQKVAPVISLINSTSCIVSSGFMSHQICNVLANTHVNFWILKTSGDWLSGHFLFWKFVKQLTITVLFVVGMLWLELYTFRAHCCTCAVLQ